MIEMSESDENWTTWREIEATRQIDVALVPEGVQIIWRLIRCSHSNISDLYSWKIELQRVEKKNNKDRLKNGTIYFN